MKSTLKIIMLLVAFVNEKIKVILNIIIIKYYLTQT